MTRRPARAPTRRLALALSVMLLAAALAVPAFASSHTTGKSTPGISAPIEGHTYYFADTLELGAQDTGASSVQWALRLVDPDRDSEGTFAGNVDGFRDEFSFDDGEFSAEIDLTEYAHLPPSDEYYFVFNPSPGGRYVVQFSITDKRLVEFDTGDIETCTEGQECSISTTGGDNNNYTVSTDNAQPKDGLIPRIGLRLGDNEDPLAAAVDQACRELLAEEDEDGSRLRLGPQVVHLLPIDLAAGTDLTVTSTIPMEYVLDRGIDEDVRSRGNAAFQVCIAPTLGEKQAYLDAGYSNEDLGQIDDANGLVGPILLNDCETDEETACVESRDRTDNELTEEKTLNITYRIPAVDPWMM